MSAALFAALFAREIKERSVSQALARSRKTIGLHNGQTFHDLRRTANTLMTKLGVPSEIRARVMNHAKRGVTDGVCDAWEYEPEKRVALNSWAGRLEEIVGKSFDQVHAAVADCPPRPR